MQNSRNYSDEFREVYRIKGLAKALIYDLERTVGVTIADSLIACTIEGLGFVKSMVTLPYTFCVIGKSLKERENKKVASENVVEKI